MKHISNDRLKISCRTGDIYKETVSIKLDDGSWQPVLDSADFVCQITDERHEPVYYLEPSRLELNEKVSDKQMVIVIDHPNHTITRKISLDRNRSDLVHFDIVFKAKAKIDLKAVEDKWSFLVDRREEDNELLGKLDFVWSQRIKSFPTSFISHYNYRTPIVMMQQKDLFWGLIPGLESVTADDLEQMPLGMDLNITREKYPWASIGLIVGKAMSPDKPCEAGHSQIVRGHDPSYSQMNLQAGDELSYKYTIMLSQQPDKLGYREANRYLWQRYGTGNVGPLASNIQNSRYDGVKVLSDWRHEIWDIKAEKEFFSYEKNGVKVGALAGQRQGDCYSRTDYQHDAWFGCWLQELLTGMGLFYYGSHNPGSPWLERCQQILNYILSAPRNHGMFPIVCYYESDGTETWLRDDAWAGFRNEYHSLQMAWTAWLMLNWARDLFPERKSEILEFCLPLGDFFIEKQNQDGCIPSWYNEHGEPEREHFRDFNAETSTCALFLLELGMITGNKIYLDAGRKALKFVDEKVRPRQRWFDLETFLSCAKKPFDFYDKLTGQYPQCNLSEMHAAFAYLRQYELTGDEADLEKAEQVLDYLLLTQQLWNHPLISINTFGGFTVQNTDHEWSDVREGICVMILEQYYRATGKREYLERCIAARHSGFAVLPYENWAHCGYEGMQYDSSLLWGGGVILTAAEYIDEKYGAFVVNADDQYGLGIDGCCVNSVDLDEQTLTIEVNDIRHPAGSRLSFKVNYSGANDLEVIVNGQSIGKFSKEDLNTPIEWIFDSLASTNI